MRKAMGLVRRILTSKLTPPFLFAATALFVLWDLLAPGFILTLDMLFTPSIRASDMFYGLDIAWSSDLPLWLILEYLGKLLPVWFWQKVVLFLVLFLAGFSAYRLCPAPHRAGKYFAGLLYMLNPFVYVRFMAGQWKILLAYAILPFLVQSFLDFLEEPTPRRAVKLGLLLALTGIFSLSILFAASVLLVILLAAKLYRVRRDKNGLMRLATWGTLSLALFLGLNLYWLVPTFMAKETVLTQMSYKDLQAFTAQTWGTGFNALFSVATLHGFWRGGYHYISQILPGWQVVFGLLLFLAVYGAVLYWKDLRLGLHVKALCLAAGISLVLGTGISTPPFSGVYSFLFDTVPLFKGMRDSQRFAAMLALAYSFLGGLGVAGLLASVQGISGAVKRWSVRAALIVLALSLPVLYSLNMLWGFDNELKVTDYPADWYEVDQYLAEQEGDFNVLFLPWHGYMTFSWNPQQRIMNPASMFFRRPVIRSDNLEVGPIDTESAKSSQHYISFLLDRKGDIQRLGALLAPLDIRYVLLAKEADYQSYSFLYDQEDLTVVKETAKLVLLRNQADTAKFYFSRDLARMGTREDMLLAATRGRSLVNNAYLLEQGGDGLLRSAFTPIAYQRLSPVRYRVDVPERGYVVFAVPFAGDWRLDGQPPQANLGLTNVFPADKGEATVYLRSFSLFLAPHALSLLTLAGGLAFLLWRRPKRPGDTTTASTDAGPQWPHVGWV